MWGSVTDWGPPLTQVWFKASCRYMLRKHTIDPEMCWCNLHYSDAGHCVRRCPTFKRHWGVVYYVHALPPT